MREIARFSSIAIPRHCQARRAPVGAKESVRRTTATTSCGSSSCSFTCRDADLDRNILGAYDAIVRWARENGRELAGPPREVCLAQEPLRLQIACP